MSVHVEYIFPSDVSGAGGPQDLEVGAGESAQIKFFIALQRLANQDYESIAQLRTVFAAEGYSIGKISQDLELREALDKQERLPELPIVFYEAWQTTIADLILARLVISYIAETEIEWN